MKWFYLLYLLHATIISAAFFYPSLPLPYLPVASPRLPLATAIQSANSETKLRLSNNDDGADDGDDHKSQQDLLLPASILSTTAVVASIGTLWSEFSVIMTGCGPRLLPDAVERGCYLGVLVIAGSSVFIRIVTGGNGLAVVIGNVGMKSDDGSSSANDDNLVLQIKLVEWLSLLAVAGAFVALGSQTINGEQMDGLSGINEDMCREIQQLN